MEQSQVQLPSQAGAQSRRRQSPSRTAGSHPAVPKPVAQPGQRGLAAAAATRSLRILMDELNRKPNAMIVGR
jgi:hypothetical protein